jgi:hypothetical protein
VAWDSWGLRRHRELEGDRRGKRITGNKRRKGKEEKSGLKRAFSRESKSLSRLLGVGKGRGREEEVRGVQDPERSEEPGESQSGSPEKESRGA